MKKFKYISFMLLGLFLTGCTNGKKIECSYYNDDSTQKVTYNHTLKFDESGYILKTYELKSQYEFKNKSANTQDICKEVMSGISKEMKEYVSCKETKGDNSLTVTIKYNYDKLDDKHKQKIIDNLTYDEFKENYEMNQYKNDICAFDSKDKIEPTLYDDDILDILAGANEKNVTNTADVILMASESFVATYLLEHNGDFPNKVTFVCDGNDCSATVNGKKTTLNFKGLKPTSGEITVTLAGATITKPLVMKNYICTMKNSDEVECIK